MGGDEALPSADSPVALLFVKQSSSITTVETSSSQVLFTISTAASSRNRCFFLTGNRAGPVARLSRGTEGKDVVADVRGTKVRIGTKGKGQKVMTEEEFIGVVEDESGRITDCFRSDVAGRNYRFETASSRLPHVVNLVATEDDTLLATWSEDPTSVRAPPQTVLLTMSLRPPALVPGPHRLFEPDTQTTTILMEEVMAAYLVCKWAKRTTFEHWTDTPGRFLARSQCPIS